AIVWDPEAGTAARRLPAAPGAPYIVSFLDERRLLVRTAPDALTVYDVETGDALALVGAGGAAISAASGLGDGEGAVVGSAGADARFVATFRGGVALWEVATGRCLGWWATGHDAWCAYSADGRSATLSGASGPWVRFDLGTSRVERSESAGFPALLVSPDGG